MPPTPRLREIIRAFDTAPRPLLLHCQGGVERSGLVGAVAVLLHGGTLEEARAQFAPSEGYIAFSSRSELPQVLDEYEEWLAPRGEPHSADHFRAWVAEDYHPYFYRAGIAPVEVPATWAAGVETVLRFQVTNRSKRPIPFQSSPERGVHLGAFVHAEGDGDAAPRELRAGFVDLELAPGASATLDLAVPPLPPGAFRLEVDLVDEGYKWFQAMGSEPLSLRFEVLGEG